MPIVAATLIVQLPAGTAHAAAKVLTTPVDVTGVKVKPVSVTARPEWTATDRELTEADLPPDPVDPGGVQTVALAASPTLAAKSAAARGVKAGSLPIFVQATPSSPPARGAVRPLGKVRVEVLNRKATSVAGVKGLVVKLARADGVAQAGLANVTVDYRAARGLFGGDARTRLQLIRLSDGHPVPAVNNSKAGTLTATMSLAASGAATGFAVAAAPQGENGDYKASTLTAASTWHVSQQTGSFAWSYPIKAPAPPGGVAPNLALSYDSGSIDGRTSGNNTQGSWAGDGWDIWPGFIERSYRSCADDRDEKEKPNPNNKDEAGGDLCYFDDNATMSFNGSSTELVKVAGPDSKTVRYRGVSDDGSTIEQVNGGAYWQVTTVDGTRYFFGRDKGDGGSSAGTSTNSVWTVPVYSNHPDEDGYDKDFAKSKVIRPWRWNLDYAVDPSGNTITYFYQKESGAYAGDGDKDNRTTYDRGGYLTRVEYGSRSDAAATVRPTDRIVFDTADRCLGKCLNSSGKPIATRFPDTPWEQYCDQAPCATQFSPTFWTQKRLAKVTAQVYAGTGDTYTDVDSWTLAQTYLQAGNNESTPMFLKSITHTALVTSAGGAAVTYPPVVFDPNADIMPNRVDTPNGHSSLFRSRIATITTESGAQIGVSYSRPECDDSPLPKPWSNTKRCFPQFYGAEGEDAKIDWFNKYVVTRLDVYDNTGGFEHQQTSYDYLDTPAWAYDDSELTKPKKRTWGQFRGYGRVQVREGVESGVQSRTEYRYFRGLDGDKQPQTDELPPTGVPRRVQVEDSFRDKVDDHPAFAGMVREEIVYNGTDWVSGTLNTPVAEGPTATSGPLRAWKVHNETVRKRTKLSNGTTRWTKTITKVNADNLTAEVSDLGDEADLHDDRCARTEYARNEATGMLDRVKRTETVGVGCDTEVQRPRDVLSDTRTYYDNADEYGVAPTRGLPVRVEQLDSWNGATPVYVTAGRTGYDALGRMVAQSNALGHTSSTAYLPASGGPVTQTVMTNPLGQRTVTTLNPALAVPVRTIDINGGLTEATYDGAGRLLAMWAPGRDRKTFPKDPSVSYAYQVSKTVSSTVTTKTLMPYSDATYRTIVTLYDGLLRERQSQTQTIAGGRAIIDSVYDSRGLLDWTSNPYYDIDNTAPNTTLVTAQGRPEIPALTQNVYDGAGRRTNVVFVVNGDEKWRTTTVYAGEKTSVTPPEGGTATTTVVDAHGRQAEVRQYKDRAMVGGDDPTTFDRTAYRYTARDELTSVIGPGPNTWTYGYDLRGRKVSTQDPDNGESAAGYDAAGQLSWSRDGRGKVLAFTYDDVGRRTAVRQASPAGPKLAEWEYDTLPNGVGKIARSTHYEYDAAGMASAYTNAITGYDAAGRPKGSSVTIPTSESGLCVSGGTDPCTFSQDVTYRPNGAVFETSLPAVAGLPAETLRNIYNKVGLENGLLGLDTQIYTQEIVYNQLDQLIAQNLGEHNSRIGLTYTYDEPTARRTNFTAVPELKNDIYHLKYTYDKAGDLTAISDTPDGNQPAETQCFGYDYLTRLTDAWTPASQACGTAPTVATLGGPAPYWRSYTYDGSGNRKTEVLHATANTTRAYAYPAPGGGAGSKPHAVTQVSTIGATPGTAQYAYDASGNMVCRPASAAANTCDANGAAGAASQALTWNDEGHLARSTDKTGDTSFVYDADGNRLIRRDPAGATLYLPGGTEIRKPKTGAATGTRYYSQAGSTVAVRTPAGVTWLVDDHHGTASATVSSDASLTVTRRRTLPFGEVRGVAPTVWAGDKGFVGGTQDNTGLTHLGAREYDPALGRFASVDPMMDLADPQQWVGYNYANDTPLTLSDPTGLDPCISGGGGCHYDGTDPGGNGYGGPLSSAGNRGSGSHHGGGDTGAGNSTSGNQNGNGAANSTVQVTTTGARNRCGPFSWICGKAQTTMEWVHENQNTLGQIAVDLLELDASIDMMTFGVSVIGGGFVMTDTGVLAVVGLPAMAAGVAVTAAGGALAVHGGHELGKDLRNLHMNNEAAPEGKSDAAADVGAARETKVAEITGGHIPSGSPGAPGLRIVKPNVGSSDVDVIGPNGEYIAVGGPAKARNIGKLGEKLGILKYAADQAGVSAQAYFEVGTPQAALNKAIQVLGRENVFTFER